MVAEYVIKLGSKDPVPDLDRIGEILKYVPGYYGPVEYEGSEALENRRTIHFRSGKAREDLTLYPDVMVGCHGRKIVISPYDTDSTERVLGALVASLVSDAFGEHVDVYMLGAEPQDEDSV